MFDKFLVVKWDWVEDALSDNELNDLYHLLSIVTEDKPEHKYYVVNADEPYADRVEALIKNSSPKISRKDLLSSLKELHDEQGDIEAMHAEADELLLRYINDTEVEEAFEEVPKWYA